MAKDRDHLADGFDTDNSGRLSLAEEDDLDRAALWRLGSWGVGSVAAVIVAVMASQSSVGLRREQIASADLARQSQQLQSVAQESQTEARRLASAIDTLNGDRDRLYSRVTVLEQGLDSVTGSIARQNRRRHFAASRPILRPNATRATDLRSGPPPAAPRETAVAALSRSSRATAAPRKPERRRRPQCR